MNVNLISTIGSFSFNNISENENIYVDGKPLNNKNLKNYIVPIGNHEIELKNIKLNKEIYGNIDVASDNHYDISFNYSQFSFKPLLYSSVIPGMGQIYSKSYMKGSLILISTLATGGLLVWAINNYHQKTNEYNLLQEKYHSAETEAEASYYRSLTQNAYDKTNTASTLKDLAIVTLAGIYLYNLLDAVIFSGKLDVIHYYRQGSQIQIKNEIDGNKIKVGMQWNF